jgi:UDP-N-acetylmuramoyl-tripeptide--D-alanyl-D-alanine ligase
MMIPSFDVDELARWSGGQWVSRPSRPLSAVVHDTRQVVPGALFVAILGARFDGHAFIGEAAQKGAGAALVSRDRCGEFASLNIPLLLVEDPACALRDIATGYRLKLGLPVIGVTGSTGKTTVKEMIARLLESAMPTARTKGNWNNEIGLPLSILAIPSESRAAVLELGISHPGEMAPLCGIARPDWGVITNVGPVHLEFFQSVEAIAREKGELFRSLPAGGTAVLSLDEPCFKLLHGLAPCRVVTTSLDPQSDADYVLVRASRQGGECVVADRIDAGTYSFRLPLPGAHNRHNALLAIAVARGFGVTWDGIAAACEGLVAPPMRWECRDIGGFIIINDAYNANPVSMQASLRTFREWEGASRKWLALGDMLELGPGEIEAHRDIGRALADGPWAGLVTVGVLGARMAEGALAAGMSAELVQACGTVSEAAEYLKERMAKGDALLIKASRGKRLEDIIPGLLAGTEKG